MVNTIRTQIQRADERKIGSRTMNQKQNDTHTQQERLQEVNTDERKLTNLQIHSVISRLGLGWNLIIWTSTQSNALTSGYFKI
jgi:hypothetical protein